MFLQEGVACIMFLYVLAQTRSLSWHRKLNTLVRQNKKGASSMDGAPFVVGVVTLLKQFHSSHIHTFLGYMGQYIRSQLSATATAKVAQGIPVEVKSALFFLEEFCKFSGVSRASIETVVPSYLFDRILS
jgi:WASH complex subunit strumpellin